MAYLRLALEINKHVDGYVDAYYGPTELKAQVEAAEKRPPAALLDDLAWLQAHVPTGDPARQSYLEATLRAMDCTLRLANGEQFDYLDEVHRLYDVSPAQVDESVFTAAHQELDILLPGTGSLSERLEARRQRYELRPEQALPLIELARDETRQRTAALVDLVDGEAVELRLTSNQPWSAYNWYLGHARSLIEFNTDLPISALAILATFAHEGYPGHHTEAQLKEKHIYLARGYAEQAAMLLHSPAAVIAEGLATTAVEIIFPNHKNPRESAPSASPPDHHDWNAEVLLPEAERVSGRLGELTQETANQLRRLARASHNLRAVSGNAAILFHTGQASQAQTIEYIHTYALANKQRAQQSFRFLSNPLFRSYLFTYTQGYNLIEQAAGGDSKWPLFHRLLLHQVLPSQLAQVETGNPNPKSKIQNPKS
ncbi:MAG: hypothetical protein AB1791_19925 [Chloroflexota bacterium]